MAIPGGLFAVAHTEIAPDEFGQAWTALMGGWLPESGYQPTTGSATRSTSTTPSSILRASSSSRSANP